jgi:hypothetical protein
MKRLFRTMIFLCTLTMLEGLLASPILADGSGQVTGEIILTLESDISKMLPHTSPRAPTTKTGNPESWRMKDTATLKVCIQNGRASVGDVKRELIFTGEKDEKTVDAKTDCTPIHQTRSNIDIRRPGNWRTSSHSLKHLLMQPEEAKKKYNMKLESRVTITPLVRPKTQEERRERRALKESVIGGLPKGKYNVDVHTESAVSFSGHLRTESHNVCTGITTSYFVQYLPDDPGKKEFSKVDRGEHSTSILSIVPYRKYPLFGSWEIDYDPNGSGGSNIIWKDKKSSLYVQWSFKPNDLCQKLREMIENDLLYAEGYLDKATRQRPMNNYKCHVDRWVFERMYGSPPPPGVLDCEKKPDGDGKKPGRGGGDGVGDEIGVDRDCNLVNEKPYREKAKRNCTPEEVISGIMAHEKTHVEQCKRDRARYNTSDPAVWGDMEVAAHLVGIANMLKSLKRLCPNYDTTAYEIRMETINRSRLKP